MRHTILAAAAALALLPATAAADWHEPVGGPSPINESAARNADDVWLTAVAGRPYVAWNEDNTQPGSGSSSQIRVARLATDGTAWEKVADGGTHPISRLASTSSHKPTIADVSGIPWVAWTENITQTDVEVRVARLNGAGTAWQRVVDTTHPINNDQSDGTADQATIAADDSGSRPFVSFSEADPGSGSLFFNGRQPQGIWVKRLSADGTSWETVGGGSVSDPALDAAFPRMTIVDGQPWVTYFQVAIVGGGPQLIIQTAHPSADGQSWIHTPVVAGDVNRFDSPAIATVAGRPEVAFGDTQGGSTSRIRVVRLNDAGDGYNDVGDGPASPAGANAQAATLTAIGDVPWVAWRQRGSGGAQQVHAARLNGNAWQPVGTQGNDDATHDAGYGPALASVNGFPWLAFGESDNTSQGGNGSRPCCTQERVSRIEPTLGSPSAQPSDTQATLLQPIAATYGLPFPVRFVYAPRGGSAAQTDAVTPAFDPDTLFRSVGGLFPSTLYTFHGQTTAGTPLPPVAGPESVFVTNAAGSGATGGGGGGTPTFIAPRLLVAILDHAAAVRSGHRFTLRYVVTDDATATLKIRRKGKVVRTIVRRVAAGRHAFLWTARTGGRKAARGRYAFAITAVASGGRTASDQTRARVTASRRR